MNVQPQVDTRALAAPPPRQYLSFRVAEQEYAIDILRVQEIRGHTAITTLPQTQPWVRGAMNLRGVIVPVLDVKERFGQGPTDYHRFSAIVVVSAGQRMVGLLVDAVSDVVELAANQVEPPPDVSQGSGFVSGLGRLADRLLILLDLERVIS
jgi:purine-binding chemotaxis protein CheW